MSRVRGLVTRKQIFKRDTQNISEYSELNVRNKALSSFNAANEMVVYVIAFYLQDLR